MTVPETKSSLNLSVPKRHIGPIALLLKASDAEFNEFEKALGELEATENVVGLIRNAGTQAGWSKSQGESLVGLLVSLSAMVDDLSSTTLEDFTAEIARAAEATGDNHLEASREQWMALQERLQRLLGPEHALWLPTKAATVLREHERVFCDARILTDVRPVFGRATTEEPIAVAVVHTLKIDYHHGSQEVDSFFMSVQSEDLQELRRLVQRAEEKQASLEALVEKAGIKLLVPKAD